MLRRLFQGDRIVARIRRWMSTEAVTACGSGFMLQRNEGVADAVCIHVEAIEPQTRIGVGPSIGHLRHRDSCSAIEADAIDDLLGPAHVNVATEDDLHIRLLEGLEDSTAMGLINGEIPLVILFCSGQIPRRLIRLIEEQHVVHRHHVMNRRRQ